MWVDNFIKLNYYMCWSCVAMLSIVWFVVVIQERGLCEFINAYVRIRRGVLTRWILLECPYIHVELCQEECLLVQKRGLVAYPKLRESAWSSEEGAQGFRRGDLVQERTKYWAGTTCIRIKLHRRVALHNESYVHLWRYICWVVIDLMS